MLEALIKYPPSLYASGSVEVGWPWAVWFALCAASLPLAWWLSSRDAAPALGPRERWLAAALRAALLVLLLGLLARPVLVVSSAEVERGSVLVLIDESMSMSLADGGASSRGARAAALLDPREGELSAALAERFDLAWFAFGSSLRALGPGGSPQFDVPRSDLAGALRAVADGPARQSPTAVVLVSDGGIERGDLAGALLALRARGVAVHVLAAGDTDGVVDAQLGALRAPARALAGDLVEMELDVAARGLAGRSAALRVSVDGAGRLEREVELPADGVAKRLAFTLPLADSGVARVEATLEALAGETVTGNNAASALLRVLPESVPLLHYEAEPRFEVKFLRRALGDDDVLPLTSLVRTADNKFYRLGADTGDDMAGGFPTEAAELFRFGVVVLGLSQVATLDERRLALLDDFVARRGGALLLLGGAGAGQRLPAVIQRLTPLVADGDGVGRSAVVRVVASEAAARHPLTAFLVAPDAPTPLADLPELTVTMAGLDAKPGATVLLRGEPSAGGRSLVVMAEHRYGRGRVVALPVTDSWRWQMHEDIAVDDRTHETLWRQLLRWLARDVPARLAFAATPEDAVPGTPVTVRVVSRAADWRPRIDAPPLLAVSTPLGDRITPLLQVVPGEPGVYEAVFVPSVSGAYELRASDSDERQLVAESWLQVSARGREFLMPRQQESLLRRVAAGTGGSYRPMGDAGGLVQAIQRPASVEDVSRRLPLWDLPLAYLLLVLLACGEWWLRRRRRLP